MRGTSFCQRIAALLFAQVHMGFVIVCFSVTLNMSAPTRMWIVKFEFVGFFENSQFNKFDKNNEHFTWIHKHSVASLDTV